MNQRDSVCICLMFSNCKLTTGAKCAACRNHKCSRTQKAVTNLHVCAAVTLETYQTVATESRHGDYPVAVEAAVCFTSWIKIEKWHRVLPFLTIKVLLVVPISGF